MNKELLFSPTPHHLSTFSPSPTLNASAFASSPSPSPYSFSSSPRSININANANTNPHQFTPAPPITTATVNKAATSTLSATTSTTLKTTTSTQPHHTHASLDYPRLLSVFVDKFTRGLHDRQTVVLDKICKYNQNGFVIRDIGHIGDLLAHLVDIYKTKQSITASTTTGQSPFDLNVLLPSITQLVSLCGVPLIREKSGDTLRHRSDMVSFVRSVGETLLWDDPAVQCAAAEALRQFVTSSPHPTPPLTFYQEVVAESEVISTFLHVLSTTNSDVTKYEILKTMSVFAGWKKNLLQMTEQGSVLRILAGLVEQGSITTPTLDLLWKVLEYVPEARAGPYVGPLINAFKNILSSALQMNITSKIHKDLRDDVIAVVGMLAVVPENRQHFLASGFLDLLLYCVTCHEFGKVKDNSKILDQFVNSNSQEDFELRKLMMNIVLHVSPHQSCYNSLTKARFIEMLLLYLTTPVTNPAVLKWADQHLKDLRLQVLCILTTLVPHLPTQYDTAQGNKILVNFLAQNMNIGSNGVLGGGDIDYPLLRGTLDVVMSTATLFKKKLGLEGIVKSLLVLLRDTNNQPLPVKQQAVIIISLLCKDNKTNQLEFGEKTGVLTILPLMKYNPQEPIRKEDLIISVIDCVWTTIVGHPANEPKFFDNGGVAHMLNLLEVCPALIQFQVLGCLSDLLENRRGYILVREWYSTATLRTAAQLLISLWCKEEKRLEVAEDFGGTMPDSSIRRPLLTKRDVKTKEQWRAERQPYKLPPKPGNLATDQSNESVDSDSEQDLDSMSNNESRTPTYLRLLKMNPAPQIHLSSSFLQAEVPTPRATRRATQQVVSATEKIVQAVAELDLRDKIFAIFYKIGFGNHDHLTNAEQIKLMLIEKYFDFRVGEVWEDINEELEYENVRPVTPDEEIINSQTQRILNISTSLQKAQKTLLNQKYEHELAEEKKMYESIKQHVEYKEKSKQDAVLRARPKFQKDAIKALNTRKEMIKNSRVRMNRLDDSEVYELDFRADAKALDVLQQQQEEDDEDHYIDF